MTVKIISRARLRKALSSVGGSLFLILSPTKQWGRISNWNCWVTRLPGIRGSRADSARMDNHYDELMWHAMRQEYPDKDIPPPKIDHDRPRRIAEGLE